MNDISTPRTYRCDLNHGTCIVNLKAPLMHQDSLADVFRVAVCRANVPVDLAGMGVTGYLYYASTRQTLLLQGTTDGHYASVALSSPCYATPGYASLVIQLQDGDVRHILLKANFCIDRTGTESVLDPDDVLPSLPDLLGQIETLRAVTAQGKEVIADIQADTDAAIARTDAAATSADAAAKAAEAAGQEAVRIAREASQPAIAASQDAAQSAQEAAATLSTVKETVIQETAQAVEVIAVKGEETLASIPEDYTGLTREVAALTEEIGDLQDFKRWENIDVGELIENEYVLTTNGKLLTYDRYIRTDYIDITGCCFVKTKVGTTNANVGYAFYNENKEFVSGSDFAGKTIGDVVEIPVPTGAVYFVTSAFPVTNAGYLTVDGYKDVPGIARVQELISENANATDEKIIALDEKFAAQLLYDVKLAYDGYMSILSGMVKDATSYKCSDYIKLCRKRLIVTEYYSDTAGLCFYDRGQNFILGCARTAETVGGISTITVPDNAVYFRVSCLSKSSYLSNFRCYSDGAILAQTPEAEEDSETETINPCFYTDTHECKVFKKILCIGDSLTEGRCEYKVDGTNKEFTATDYSYPTFLKAFTGRDVTNAGDAGETTVSWYNIHQNDDLSGHDACIIALGRNDYVPDDRETTDEQRIEALNAIITKVKTENPQITIFLSTLINYYVGDGADGMNAVIRSVADSVDGVHLVDISAYGQMVMDVDNYSHCTAVGYATLAEYYYNYISYIISRNHGNFKNVQFAGTDRAYS